MWLAALAQTLLVTLSTAQPGNPNEIPKPPAFFEASGPIRITGIENATLTIKRVDGQRVEYRPVMTANGPRIRLVLGGVTLEATRLQERIGGWVFTSEVAKDGKTMTVTPEPDPGAAKPPPKPKQP